MRTDAERFRLGVNYWPSETAMEWLPNYDGDVVRRDFSRIATAGMDTVRIFLRWEDLQPTATRIERTAIAAVVDTADAASEVGVELIVTLFTGHMSGVNWIPTWATGGTDGDARFRVVSGGTVQPGREVLRNWYGDADLGDAQALQADTVASALAGHPALWAWDLGNENSNCTIPAGRHRRRPLAGTDVIGAPSPRPAPAHHHRHAHGGPRGRAHARPAQAARWCDFVCMHGYPIYADWSAGPTDECLVPYLAEITGWLAGDAPVLFAEFGHPTAPPGRSPTGVQVREEDAAAYTGRTLDALRDCGSIGALVWCYADYHPDLHHRPPLDLADHERTFGLWRRDGSPKPAVAEIAGRQNRSRSRGSRG